MIQGCAASKDVADCCPDAHTTSYASSEAPNHPSSLAEKASLSCLLKPRDSPFRGGHLCSTSHSGCLRFFGLGFMSSRDSPPRPPRAGANGFLGSIQSLQGRSSGLGTACRARRASALGQR